jgi:hypothetical protein
MSTIAVENSRSDRHISGGSKRLPATRKSEMRIVETAAAGIIALASQFLVIAAVLI